MSIKTKPAPSEIRPAPAVTEASPPPKFDAGIEKLSHTLNRFAVATLPQRRLTDPKIMALEKRVTASCEKLRRLEERFAASYEKVRCLLDRLERKVANAPDHLLPKEREDYARQVKDKRKRLANLEDLYRKEKENFLASITLLAVAPRSAELDTVEKCTEAFRKSVAGVSITVASMPSHIMPALRSIDIFSKKVKEALSGLSRTERKIAINALKECGLARARYVANFMKELRGFKKKERARTFKRLREKERKLALARLREHPSEAPSIKHTLEMLRELPKPHQADIVERLRKNWEVEAVSIRAFYGMHTEFQKLDDFNARMRKELHM